MPGFKEPRPQNRKIERGLQLSCFSANPCHIIAIGLTSHALRTRHTTSNVSQNRFISDLFHGSIWEEALENIWEREGPVIGQTHSK